MFTDWDKPILNLSQGKAWIEGLCAAGKSFHLEDDPAHITGVDDSTPFFTPAQAAVIRDRVAELYALDWGELECPIGYLLDVEERRQRNHGR